MKQFSNTIQLHSLFGNMARPRHVLLVIKDEMGKYLLGAKPDFYPEGIFRFAGGGVDKEEKPIQAAIREAQEELQITVNKQDLQPLAEVITESTFQNNTVQNVTTLFLLQITAHQKLSASDDIAYLQSMSAKELQELIERYKQLPLDIPFKDGKYQIYWQDYGQMYSFIHQVGLDLTS